MAARDSLGGRIEYIRTERGLSQAKLAEKLGTTRGCVSNWENGRREPRGMLLKLSHALGVSVSYLSGMISLQEERFFRDCAENGISDTLDISFLEPQLKVSLIECYQYPVDKQQQLSFRKHIRKKIDSKK